MSTVTLDKKTILVTGAAGFIGSNLVKRIYQEAPSATVIGIDNMKCRIKTAMFWCVPASSRPRSRSRA